MYRIKKNMHYFEKQIFAIAIYVIFFFRQGLDM